METKRPNVRFPAPLEHSYRFDEEKRPLLIPEDCNYNFDEEKASTAVDSMATTKVEGAVRGWR